MASEIVTFAVDTGSKQSRAATWVCSLSKERCGHDLGDLVVNILDQLNAGKRVALGFECVLFLPCPEDENDLGRARNGECTPETQNRPFTAAAGACATMSGLPQLAWILREVKRDRSDTRATTRWDVFAEEQADIFIWEAFVSGFEKGESHQADAAFAVEAFEKSIGSMQRASRVTVDHPISLAGMLVLWAGLSNDLALLHEPVIVLRPLMDARTMADNKRRIIAERGRLREHRRQKAGGA